MDAKERLRKLNKYLISKGRPPKRTGHVDFVKRNISSATKKRKSSVPSAKRYETSIVSSVKKSLVTPKKHAAAASVKNTERISEKLLAKSNNNNLIHIPRNTPRTQQKLVTKSIKKENKTPRIHQPTAKTTNRQTPVGWSHEKMRKKLVRRSINVVAQAAKKTPKTRIKASVSKTPRLTAEKRQPFTPASTNLNCSLRRRVLQTKSAGPCLASISKTSKKTEDQIKLYEKLNNWLVAKGKKPLDGRKIRGFKPTKTIATPAGSPAQTSKALPSGGSHWQGLRDEDFSDELAVLIRHTMNDVAICIGEDCPADILRSTLDELAEKMPVVKSHAMYWVTLSQVVRKSGKSDDEICDLYEQAILAKAQPIEEIQAEINNLVMRKIEKKENVCDDQNIPSRDIATVESRDQYRPIPTNQCKTPNPVVERLIRSETPVFKNAATSPIIFESPKPGTEADLEKGNSPSSMVKLRMVSKSSPVFNRLKALRALPADASAIVTPVRRSRRIEMAQENYPKGLLDHDPCLATVQEILPALEYNYVPDKKTDVTCDIVFDPNLALGDDFADLATVLKF